MNEFKGTPGPWRIGYSDGSGQTYILAGHASNPATVIRGHSDDYGIPGGVLNPDDARLIAAAPDLLEAAVQARGVLHTVLGEATDATAVEVLERRIQTLTYAIDKALSK